MRAGAWSRAGIARTVVCLALLSGIVTGRGDSLRAEEPKADPREITLDRIFGGDFNAAGYGGQWLSDSSGYLRLESSKGPNGGQELAVYQPEDGAKRSLVPSEQLVPNGETRPLSVEDYAWSDDGSKLLIYTNSRKVWRQNTRGDYWVLDRTSRELRRVGRERPEATLMFAKLSPDGQRVAYVWRNNIYVESLQDGETIALTDDGGDEIINGTFDWVYEEELGVRDGFAWSPDGQSIAFWQLDTSGVRRFSLIDNTAGLYPAINSFPYPKAGERNSACRIGVRDLSGGDVRWLDIPGDPREHYLARMEWAPGTRRLLVQQLNRLQNQNHLFVADADSGACEELFVDRDEAWVDVHDELHWFGGDRFTWISEHDGWRHVYLGGLDRPLVPATRGDFDVIELLAIDDAGGELLFIASPENATQRYLFRATLDQGAPGSAKIERLTPADQPGTHSYTVSPDRQWALHTWSQFGQPPVVDLVRLPSHERVRVLEENKRLNETLAALKDRRPHVEFFTVETEDGVPMDAWCVGPPELAQPQGIKAASHPLLIYVYGEPAGQTVLDRWGGRNDIWHWMLAQRGYVVVSIDNRGTPAPKGRAWRRHIYRHVGTLAAVDQAAGVRKLLETRPYLDKERVGVWGWSGGGSMTLNAMFRYPELYHVGVSVAPVPNERLYDTIYQERYMGLPQDNVDGYYNGSAVNFAHQLAGSLLVIHGTGDDNVHYQGAEGLFNELIRHNRPFSMMAYPNRSHSIHEGANTSRHLRELITGYLDRELLRRGK